MLLALPGLADGLISKVKIIVNGKMEARIFVSESWLFETNPSHKHTVTPCIEECQASRKQRKESCPLENIQVVNEMHSTGHL